MKLRPQVQFRFRDVKQFESVKLFARKAEVSVNEWLLVAVEQRLDDASGTTLQNLAAKIGRQVIPTETPVPSTVASGDYRAGIGDSKPKHALGCHCYMCRPPKDK